MKFTIENIKSMYKDCRFVAMCLDDDPEPFNIYVVDSTNKILSVYDSVWSDDFKTTEYEMSYFYNYFGRDMDEVAEEVVEDDVVVKYL